MKKNIFLIIFLFLAFSKANGQADTIYLKTNAVRINNPEKLSDSIYNMLSAFQVIMFGEMHGTNESAPFINGLADLFTGKGDSVLLGFEIPSESMTQYNSLNTYSSVFASDFFSNPPYPSGKESIPWATLIANLNSNPKVKVFFFEMAGSNHSNEQRDSAMHMNIKTQMKLHPKWKVITLGGNFHNKISNPASMFSLLKQDKSLNLSGKICSLNMEYKEGTARANFTVRLAVKALGSYPSVFNSTYGYDRYLILLSGKSPYEYTGFYYTKYITAAKMANTK